MTEKNRLVRVVAVYGPPERETWETLWFGHEDTLPAARVPAPLLVPANEKFRLMVVPY
jgi:hypothetical protein